MIPIFILFKLIRKNPQTIVIISYFPDIFKRMAKVFTNLCKSAKRTVADIDFFHRLKYDVTW